MLLIEYIPGETLGSGDQAYEWLGRELAKIHSIAFDRPGQFAPNGEVVAFGDHFLGNMIEEFLAGRASSRLGAMRQPVQRLWDRRQAWLTQCASGPCLVHCDFNPKNILVYRGVWVIDWEFAMAGDPLIDLGNFLRFESDYLPSQRQAFLAAYHRPLPNGWRETARLHDLVSMLARLDSPEDLPETFATALGVVQETLRLLA